MLSAFIIGNTFGFLLQKTQFCFVSGFRAIFYRDLRFLTALFIAILVQSIGIFTLFNFELINIPNGNLPLIATLLGGFLFGLGMIISGFCASGAWFRSGEGSSGAFITLFVFALTITSAHKGALKWKMSYLENLHVINISNIHTFFDISPFFIILILLIITLLLLKISYNKNSNTLFIGAFLIGVLGILAWYFSSQNGRSFGFGVAIPTANVIEYITTGQIRYLNWGSIFVISIFTGSFLSAILNKEFKLTSPNPHEVLRKIFGGFLLGIGAYLGGGCTITNALVATAYFSAQAWLSILMIVFGVFVGSLLFKPTTCKI